MFQIAICAHPSDRAAADSLSQYLALNLDASVDLIQLTPWMDLFDALDSASSCSHTVALLSPDSIPQDWIIDQWTRVREHGIAWLLAAECRYPKILERRPFLKAEGLASFREIRRWILTGDKPVSGREVPAALAAIIDKPCRRAVEADELPQLEPYFETLVRLDARRRTMPSLASECCGRLGLDRSGDLESLLESVARECRARRILVVLEGEDPGLFPAGGRCSIGVAAPGEPAVIAAAEMADTIRASLRGRAAAPSDADLDRSLAAAFASGNWEVTKDFAWLAYEFLKQAYRLAEAFALAESLQPAALHNSDPDAFESCMAEQKWIGERWSSSVAALEFEASNPQLTFGF